MHRLLYITVALVVAGCHPGIYLRDGVTDGNTFYLAPQALSNSDPAVASWVRYSLVRSTCKLEAGGPNPARVNTYDCELMARRHLADAWRESAGSEQPTVNTYLDQLVAVQEAGFLAEYTAHYFSDDQWLLPDDLDVEAFARWNGRYLAGHRPETRLIGYWGYRQHAEDPHWP